MKAIHFCLFLSLLLLSVGTSNAVAADAAAKAASSSDVEIKLVGLKVTYDVKNKEVLLPADKVLPGDLLKYQVIYQNKSKSLLKQLTATLPMPVGVTYVAGSAQPANALASVDGKQFAAMPLKRVVTKSDGAQEEQAIPLSEYRALRWNLGELAGKSKAQVSANTRVNRDVVATATFK
jgi:hypothetical protein